jgi:hypothetical protein
MTPFGLELAAVAPYYNLALAAITLFFFIKLFITPLKNKKVYLLPWTLVFASFMIYLFEELFTVLRTTGVIDIPAHINGFFELIIISMFIYALLLQREYIKKHL